MRATSIYNNYDIYLFLLIVSTINGRYGLFIPSSVFTLFFIPHLIKNQEILRYKKIGPVTFFLLLWIFYAVVSFLWAPDFHEAYVSSLMIFINSMSFLEIIVFSMKANSPIKTLATGWICAFMLTSFVALWEITTNHHLVSAREEDLYMTTSLGDYLEKEYAAVTFYNYNTYCLYISLIFPFTLYAFSNCKRNILRLLNIIPIILIVYIMSKNSSRGGLITLGIMLVTFIFLKMKHSSFKGRTYLVLCIIALALFLVVFRDVIFQTLFFRMEEKDLLEDNARLFLWYASLQASLDSYLFGVGAGGMMPALKASDENITDIYCSHNILLEILLEYGLIITCGIVLFLVKVFKSVIKISDYRLKAVVMGSVFSFPSYSVINSENTRFTFIWMFFATIFVFSNYKEYTNKYC